MVHFIEPPRKYKDRSFGDDVRDLLIAKYLISYAYFIMNWNSSADEGMDH